jgi:hypothetical protein
MNRATWLQDRRMQKFEDVLRRWERRELNDSAIILPLLMLQPFGELNVTHGRAFDK